MRLAALSHLGPVQTIQPTVGDSSCSFETVGVMHLQDSCPKQLRRGGKGGAGGKRLLSLLQHLQIQHQLNPGDCPHPQPATVSYLPSAKSLSVLTLPCGLEFVAGHATAISTLASRNKEDAAMSQSLGLPTSPSAAAAGQIDTTVVPNTHTCLVLTLYRNLSICCRPCHYHQPQCKLWLA